MASRLDDLIREHAERLDQLAGPIDLTDVTSAPRNDTIAGRLCTSLPKAQKSEAKRATSGLPMIADDAKNTAVATVRTIGCTK